MNPVNIRPCESRQDLRLCVDLQRQIWTYADEDVVPANIFVVAQHTGGHAYLAFDKERAVGFALAFSAEDAGCRYWHSHMVGVLPDYQNRGVGRMLKLRQREDGLRAGIPRIEWTFDPLELRNAHFNITRLGAIVRRYIPNCYGESSSALHRGLPTDRLVAEWQIRSPRVDAAIAGKLPQAAGPCVVNIAVPSERAATSQSELRGQLTGLFARGYAITRFSRGSDESDKSYYLLEPYED
jgi:predicted GNAT superfamily acetyltransferase